MLLAGSISMDRALTAFTWPTYEKMMKRVASENSSGQEREFPLETTVQLALSTNDPEGTERYFPRALV